MDRCELKVWGYIGPGGEKCGGIWSIFGYFSPIYPRSLNWPPYTPAKFEESADVSVAGNLVILIFCGPCAPNGLWIPNDPGPPNSPAHEPTPSIISGRLNHGRGFGKGADRLIISLGIKGHMKRKIPNAQVGPT